ncbi:MAG: hypothetical protein ABIR91_00545 [Candidatus Saccharimonadales bacterium]
MSILERQTNFPEVDLTDRNIVVMREILRHPQILHIARPENTNGRLDDQLLRYSFDSAVSKTVQSHDAFEQVASILRTHGTKQDTVEWLDFTHGYTLDELIISLVAREDFLLSDPPATVAIESIRQTITNSSLDRFRAEAIEQFQDEQPRVSQLVIETAENQRRQSIPSALLGAAVKRQIELHGRSYTQSLVQ